LFLRLHENEGEMSDSSDLFSILDETPSSEELTASQLPRQKAATDVAKAPPSQDSLASPPGEADPSHSLNASFPVLESLEAVRERCIELLNAVDPNLAEAVPIEIPFPIEDDPFVKTAEEWEAIWYAARESAYRVYLNIRMEFRRQLSRALSDEPNDLKPWTYWAMNGSPPASGEPVHGLTPERRAELGWPYNGPVTDFKIYREPSTPEASSVP
jgi:hypothetical protein